MLECVIFRFLSVWSFGSKCCPRCHWLLHVNACVSQCVSFRLWLTFCIASHFHSDNVRISITHSTSDNAHAVDANEWSGIVRLHWTRWCMFVCASCRLYSSKRTNSCCEWIFDSMHEHEITCSLCAPVNSVSIFIFIIIVAATKRVWNANKICHCRATKWSALKTASTQLKMRSTIHRNPFWSAA